MNWKIRGSDRCAQAQARKSWKIHYSSHRDNRRPRRPPSGVFSQRILQSPVDSPKMTLSSQIFHTRCLLEFRVHLPGVIALDLAMQTQFPGITGDFCTPKSQNDQSCLHFRGKSRTIRLVTENLPGNHLRTCCRVACLQTSAGMAEIAKGAVT